MRARFDRRDCIIAVCLATLTLSFLCGCSAAARKERHMARGKAYFDKERYNEAVIEYMNVLRYDRTNNVAIRQIGFAHYKAGNLQQAFPFLLRTRDLEPGNEDVRLKLASIYVLGRRAQDARKEVAFVLGRDPSNFDALLLLTDTAMAPEDLAEAQKRLEEHAEQFKDRAPFHLAIGTVHLRKHEFALAEKAYREALRIDPKSSKAHVALSQLHRLQGDMDAADKELRTAVELASPASSETMNWVNFKLEAGKTEEAKKILQDTIQKAPDFVPARLQIARIALSEKKYDESMAAVDKILKGNPGNLDARLLKAQTLIAKGDTAGGIKEFEKLKTDFPRATQLRYQLALARLRNRDTPGAIAELDQSLSVEADQPDTTFLLAELYIRTGKADQAIKLLSPLIEKHPDLTRAYVLLAAAYRTQDKLDDAIQAYRKVIELAPGSPQGPYLLGLALRAKGDKAGALGAFEEALNLAPRFALPLTQIVAIHGADKDMVGAVARVKKQIEAVPEAQEIRYLLGQLQLMQGQTDEAEKTMLEIIKAQPKFLGAYLSLVRLYARTGKDEKALAQVTEALKVNPKDIPSLMLAGILYQRRNDIPKACEAYERILAISPQFPAAMNNLAYLYAEYMNEKDKAYDLATKAKDLVPEDPYISDTLGWILARRGDLKWALSLLKDSAEQLQDQPEVLYHLGMAYNMVGNESAARQTLERALAAGKDFPGAEKATEMISVLTIDERSITNATASATVEKVLAASPGNPSALVRKAMQMEAKGEIKEAIGAYESILKNLPQFVPALAGLARIYSEKTNDPAKALEFAKKAKEAAPEDAEVVSLLGWLAFRTGDYKWALSLLTEAAGKRPGDSVLSYRLGMAKYAAGRASEARAEVQKAIDAGMPSPHRDRARTFLALLDMVDQPADPAAAIAEAQKALAADPESVPAKMVVAAASLKQGNTAEALKQYEEIVSRYPDFVPALTGLADRLADKDDTLEKAFNTAMKARGILPEDPLVGKVLGRIVYKRGDVDWASRLLSECLAKRPSDPDIQYLLGFCRAKQKNTDAAKTMLTRALELQPDSGYADEAKRILADIQRAAP